MDARLAHWPENQRVACQELALLPGSIFEAVFRFLPEGLASRALASEALYRSVIDVPRLSSDPAVAVAKLGWWQSALPKAMQEGSQHPVIAAALAQGVLESMQERDWSAFVMQVAGRVEEDPVSTTEEWLRRFEAVEGERPLLEDDPGGATLEAWLRMSGFASGLLMELSRLSIPSASLTAFPLDLVARHQLRADTAQDANRYAALAAMARLGLERFQAVPKPDVDAIATHPVRVIADLTNAVVKQRLAWLARQGGKAAPTAPPAARFSEVWATWRAARRYAAGYS